MGDNRLKDGLDLKTASAEFRNGRLLHCEGSDQAMLGAFEHGSM